MSEWLALPASEFLASSLATEYEPVRTTVLVADEDGGRHVHFEFENTYGWVVSGYIFMPTWMTLAQMHKSILHFADLSMRSKGTG